MQPYDACRLIALNYYSFIDNPFTKDATFNSKKFYEVAYEAMRLSDNLIDLEIEHIDRIISKLNSDKEHENVKRTEIELWTKIRETAKASRRTGLGFTALGDALAALNYKYDSEEALLFIEQVSYLKMEAELDCTIDMAILRGTFDGWSKEKEFTNHPDIIGMNDFYDFVLINFHTQAKRMMEYGRRNVSWSTVAPTGTVSLLTQTTSGIEPIFSQYPYIRRKKINPNDKDVRVDFVDEVGDSWQEFVVIHPKLLEYLRFINVDFNLDPENKEDQDELVKNISNFLDNNKSPWTGSTANDIDWIKRVEIQGIVQKYTTHSISSTINLPSNVTEEEVSDIYLHSWKKMLKGITVYRDGSRSGVLIEANKEKENKLVTFNENHAPKRPKSLPCKVVRFNNNKEKWIAFVGLMDNKPYEIFTGKAENVDLPISVEIGEIKKIAEQDSNKRYDFIYEDGVIEGISKESSADYWNYGKLISSMLRHGMPLPFVVDTIQSLTWDNDNINTWKAGMARALKKFIKDGKAQGFTCMDCGSENVVFQEGCLTCKNCGSSKCG